jgi:hypothetical protein
MGIHVHLAVRADGASEAAWPRIYARARRVATQWTPRPLALAWRQIGAVRVAQYVQDLETAAGLHFVGDAWTLATGESFVFPARLEGGGWRHGRARPPARPEEDVLVAVARQCEPEAERLAPWYHLLGAKTQGLPYHTLMVALGLLVEDALPGAAVVYGEVSARDCEEARLGLAAILGEEPALPVIVDAARLRRRLAARLKGDALDEAIRMLGLPDRCSEAFADELLTRLRSTAGARFHYELEQIACACPDLSRLAAETRDLLHGLVAAIRSNVRRGKLRARLERWGAARAREELAQKTQQIGVRLTSSTWDAIEAAGLDELAFRYAATCLHTTRWETHHAVRAVLENRVLWRA